MMDFHLYLVSIESSSNCSSPLLLDGNVSKGSHHHYHLLHIQNHHLFYMKAHHLLLLDCNASRFWIHHHYHLLHIQSHHLFYMKASSSPLLLDCNASKSSE